MPRKTPARVNGHRLTLEVARSPEERRIGLSGRADVRDGTGMLFVFPKEGFHSFWMKNTSVPLVIYWLDFGRVVVDLATLTPFSLQSIVPSNPASMAVEVPLSWAVTHRILRGDRFTFV